MPFSSEHSTDDTSVSRRLQHEAIRVTCVTTVESEGSTLFHCVEEEIVSTQDSIE